MVHLKALIEGYGERGVGVHLICFAKTPSGKGTGSDYEQTLTVLDKNGCTVETLFNPQFISGTGMRPRDERVTWVVLPTGEVVYEGLSDFDGEPKELTTVLEACLAGNPPPPLAQLTTGPGSAAGASGTAPPATTPAQRGEVQAQLKKALSRMRVRRDKLTGVTWYYDDRSPRYRDTPGMFLYVGMRDSGQPWLRFVVQYVGDEYLYIDTLLIKTDNDLHTIQVKPEEVQRDSGSQGSWEWCDTAATEDILAIVQAVVASEVTQLRCRGTRYIHDRTISSGEKSALRSVLQAYELLGEARAQGLI